MYILQCRDKTYYTGYTPDLYRRFKLHSQGKGAKYTRARLPVKLVYAKKYKYFKYAFLEELRLKKLTRSEKKQIIKNACLSPIHRKSRAGNG